MVLRRPALLTIVDGQSGGVTFSLPADPARPNVIGRSANNAIAVDDVSVSREHASVRFDGSGFVLVDMNSSNGTTVDGAKVATHRLTDGAIIQVGRTKLRFAWQPESDTREEPTGVFEVGAAAAPPPAPPAEPKVALLPPAAAGGSLVELDDEEDVLELAIDLDRLEFGGGGDDLAKTLERERNKLKTIYQVSQEIGTQRTLDQQLERIMDAVFEALPHADRGFVMLRAVRDGQLVPKAVRRRDGGAGAADKVSVSRTVVDAALNEGKAILSSDAVHDERFNAKMSIVALEIRSMMCVPLVHGGETLGVIHIDSTHTERRFTQDDLSLLQGIARQAAMAVRIAKLLEAFATETSTRMSLQRFLSPALVERVMKREVDFKLGGARKHGTVFFSDIIGFTRMSSLLSPEDVVAVLNRYFQIMVGIIFEHDGMVNKFGGDSLMAIWGLTKTASGADPSRRAVEAAVRMQAAAYEFNLSLAAEGRTPVWMGIGLNTGDFVAGNIGSDRQMEYTVIGEEVNLASRIQSKAPQGMVYVSESTLAEVRGAVAAVRMRPTAMKGIAQPVTTYSIRGFVPSSTPTTEGKPRALYLCLPVEVCGPDEDRPQRGFAHQALADGDRLTLHVHVGRRLEPGSTVTVVPALPELPGPERITAVVSQQQMRKSQATTLFDVELELSDGGPLCDGCCATWSSSRVRWTPKLSHAFDFRPARPGEVVFHETWVVHLQVWWRGEQRPRRRAARPTVHEPRGGARHRGLL
jgi:adenylate cyclase